MNGTMMAGSLADQVYTLIATHNLAAAQRFSKDFPTSVYQRTHHDPLEVLNRYWRAQISSVNAINGHACARNAHDTLTAAGDQSAWLLNFKQYVVPLIVRFDLPQG